MTAAEFHPTLLHVPGKELAGTLSVLPACYKTPQSYNIASVIITFVYSINTLCPEKN